MPHVDQTLLRWPAQVQSPFARPVALLTAAARRAVTALSGIARNPERPSHAPRIAQDLEVRRLEEAFAQATDHHDLERMERAWDRRDGGGVRPWGWR
jgi:hypothetical protein